MTGPSVHLPAHPSDHEGAAEQSPLLESMLTQLGQFQAAIDQARDLVMHNEPSDSNNCINLLQQFRQLEEGDGDFKDGVKALSRDIECDQQGRYVGPPIETRFQALLGHLKSKLWQSHFYRNLEKKRRERADRWGEKDSPTTHYASHVTAARKLLMQSLSNDLFGVMLPLMGEDEAAVSDELGYLRRHQTDFGNRMKAAATPSEDRTQKIDEAATTEPLAEENAVAEDAWLAHVLQTTDAEGLTPERLGDGVYLLMDDDEEEEEEEHKPTSDAWLAQVLQNANADGLTPERLDDGVYLLMDDDDDDEVEEEEEEEEDTSNEGVDPKLHGGGLQRTLMEMMTDAAAAPDPAPYPEDVSAADPLVIEGFLQGPAAGSYAPNSQDPPDLFAATAGIHHQILRAIGRIEAEGLPLEQELATLYSVLCDLLLTINLDAQRNPSNIAPISSRLSTLKSIADLMWQLQDPNPELINRPQTRRLVEDWDRTIQEMIRSDIRAIDASLYRNNPPISDPDALRLMRHRLIGLLRQIDGEVFLPTATGADFDPLRDLFSTADGSKASAPPVWRHTDINRSLLNGGEDTTPDHPAHWRSEDSEDSPTQFSPSDAPVPAPPAAQVQLTGHRLDRPSPLLPDASPLGDTLIEDDDALPSPPADLPPLIMTPPPEPTPARRELPFLEGDESRPFGTGEPDLSFLDGATSRSIDAELDEPSGFLTNLGRGAKRLARAAMVLAAGAVGLSHHTDEATEDAAKDTDAPALTTDTPADNTVKPEPSTATPPPASLATNMLWHTEKTELLSGIDPNTLWGGLYDASLETAWEQGKSVNVRAAQQQASAMANHLLVMDHDHILNDRVEAVETHWDDPEFYQNVVGQMDDFGGWRAVLHDDTDMFTSIDSYNSVHPENPIDTMNEAVSYIADHFDQATAKLFESNAALLIDNNSDSAQTDLD